MKEKQCYLLVQTCHLHYSKEIVAYKWHRAVCLMHSALLDLHMNVHTYKIIHAHSLYMKLCNTILHFKYQKVEYVLTIIMNHILFKMKVYI